MAKKKAVDDTIFNFDIVEFFKTGMKDMEGDVFIDKNILYYQLDDPGRNKTAVGVKSGKYIMVNGDAVGNAYDARDSLQTHGDKEITTSFECLKNAELDLDDIKIIDITQDLSNRLYSNQEGFKNFENTVPQGATYSERGEYDNKRGRYTDEINLKSYHRAGCMLIQCKDSSYICGMDEDSYFVSKLSNHPKNVNSAFKSLKPRRVNEYEKKSGKQAQRQGEWFFIPVDMEADAMNKNVALPLQVKGGNEHTAEWYEEAKDRHYCKGDITHSGHDALHLGEVFHEAIQSTALGSWSVQGVD